LVRDEDGFLFGNEQDIWEISVIPSMRLTDAFELRAQYQHTESGELLGFLQKDGTTNELADSNDQFILSAILSF